MFGALRKSLFFTLFFTFLMAGYAANLLAQSQSFLPEKLIVAYNNGVPPMKFTNEQGEADGILIDLWRLWSEKSGVPVEFREATWDQAKAMVKSGKADVHAGMFYSEKRDEEFDFTQALEEMSYYVFANAEVLNIRSLEDLQGFTISVPKGYTQRYTTQTLSQNSIEVYENFTELYKAALAGEARILVSPATNLHYFLNSQESKKRFQRVSDTPFYEKQYHGVVAEGRNDLVSLINSYMSLISNQEKAAIEIKWLGSSKENTDEVITVVLARNTPPFSMMDEDGHPAGILVDMWREWGRLVGKPVQFRLNRSQYLVDEVLSGKADVMGGFPCVIDGIEQLALTKPFLAAPTYIYTHAENKGIHKARDLPAGSIAYMQGLEMDVDAYVESDRLVRYSNLDSMIDALDDEELVGFVCNAFSADFSLIERGKAGRIVRFPHPMFDSHARAAVAPGNTDLLKLVESGFAGINQDSVRRIVENWVVLPAQDENDELILTSEERAWLAEHPVIPIGVDGNWPPVDFMSEAGEHKGVAAEYIERFEKLLKVEFDARPGPTFKEMLARVRQGELKVGASIFRNDERAVDLEFTVPFFTVLRSIVSRTGSTEFREITDLYGKTVAIEDGFSTMRRLQKDYPQINLLPVENTEAALKAVSLNQADAYVGNRSVAQWLMQEHQLTNLHFSGDPQLGPSPQRFAVHKDPEWLPLVGILNKALSHITEEEKREIYKRWIDIKDAVTDTAQFTLTTEEHAWLDAHPEIRLGVDAEWPPFEFINEQGEYSGIGADYVGALNRMLGTNMRPGGKYTWAEVVEKAKNKELDVLPALTSTPEREEFLNFTRPYMVYPIVIFVHEKTKFVTELNDLAGRRVAVVGGFSVEEYLRNNHKDLIPVPYPNIYEALLDLEKGKVDAYLDNLYSGSLAIDELGITTIKIAAPTPYDYEQAIGVRKDWPELVAILDRTLAHIPQTEKDRIKQRWFSVRFEYEADRQAVWQAAAITGAIAALIIILFYLANRRLKREVIARQNAEHELRRSEGRFQLATAAVSESVWEWDLSTGERVVTPGVFLKLGYEQEQLPVSETEWADLIHALDRPAREEALEQHEANHIKRDEPIAQEYRVRRADRTYATVLSIGRVTERNGDGLPLKRAGTLRDISKRKEDEYKILRLTRAVDQSPSLVLITDPESNIVYANRKLELLTGYLQEDVMGNNARMLLAPDTAVHQLIKIQEVVKGGGEWRGELKYKRKNDGEFWAAVSTTAILNAVGELRNTVVIVDDITDKKQAEKALAEAKDAAIEANQFKSQFLANMSHEIRTPMNAIVGMSHLTLQTDLQPKQRDYLEKIQSASHALLGIINDILDFSRVEAGKLEIENISFHLETVLQNLSSLVTMKAEEKGLEILFAITPDTPRHLCGDPLRIGQVLINLVQNAIKFTEKGEILIGVSSVPKGHNTTELLFSVSDTGIGIHADKLESLFDAFSQEDQSYSRRYGGTGLGLTISKLLVEMMGGRIWVESQAGKGSTFYFELPFNLADVGKTHAYTHASISGMKALVVDDNAIARQVIGDMLSSMSFLAESLSSGEEAVIELEKAEDLGAPYDFVFMDWKMPGVDGIETVRRIKACRHIKRVPKIIMLTAYGREEVIHETEAVGVDGFLIKPVGPSLLFNTIIDVVRGDEVNEQKVVHQSSWNKRLKGEVLVVEDNRINQEVAQDMLERFGLMVKIAGNGQEALDILEHKDFDLVLMDIQMPEMDGFEATARIRMNSRWEKLPIIAMTAHAMVGDREKCLDAGMNEHIPKPIEPETLGKVLAHWLEEVPIETVENHAISKVEDLSGKLPGIDTTWGLQRIGGNLSLFRKLLKEFLADHRNTLEELKGLTDRQSDEALRVAHTLHGVAGNIGARCLQESAGDLEHDYREYQMASKKHMRRFVECFTEVKEGLESYFELEQKQKTTVQQNAGRILDNTFIAEVDKLLAQANPDGEKMLEELNFSVLDADTISLLEQVNEQLGDYEFEKARQLLEKLKK